MGDVHSPIPFPGKPKCQPARRRSGGVSFAPDYETGWTSDGYQVRVVIPEVPEKNVHVTALDNQLLVQGEREAPEDFLSDGWGSFRLPNGRFERLIDLPAELNTDKMKARLCNGILSISIPLDKPSVPRPLFAEVSAYGMYQAEPAVV